MADTEMMSLAGSALTLPGIAGLVLGIAMAVDANVLIYERIREELRAGKSPISAIDAGLHARLHHHRRLAADDAGLRARHVLARRRARSAGSP